MAKGRRATGGMGSIIPIIAVVSILVIFMTFVPSVLIETDNQTNVTGTAFESMYESNTKIQAATFSLLEPLALIFGIIMLIIGLKTLYKSK